MGAQKICAKEGKCNSCDDKIPGKALPSEAHVHRSSAIGTDRRAVRNQLRAVLPLRHLRSRRNNAPLGTCVTEESATGDGVLYEEQPVGDTSAQGYY